MVNNYGMNLVNVYLVLKINCLINNIIKINQKRVDNMSKIELYNELQNVEGCLKIADSQISELRKRRMI